MELPSCPGGHHKGVCRDGIHTVGREPRRAGTFAPCRVGCRLGFMGLAMGPLGQRRASASPSPIAYLGVTPLLTVEGVPPCRWLRDRA